MNFTLKLQILVVALLAMYSAAKLSRRSRKLSMGKKAKNKSSPAPATSGDESRVSGSSAGTLIDIVSREKTRLRNSDRLGLSSPDNVMEVDEEDEILQRIDQRLGQIEEEEDEIMQRIDQRIGQIDLRIGKNEIQEVDDEIDPRKVAKRGNDKASTKSTDGIRCSDMNGRCFSDEIPGKYDGVRGSTEEEENLDENGDDKRFGSNRIIDFVRNTNGGLASASQMRKYGRMDHHKVGKYKKSKKSMKRKGKYDKYERNDGKYDKMDRKSKKTHKVKKHKGKKQP